jgi:hypothetical protein
MVDRITGREHEADRGELVELRQQDREDQEDRGAERLHQERRRPSRAPRPRPSASCHAGAEVHLGQLVGDCLLHLRALHAFLPVGGHRHHPAAGDAVDVADARPGTALDEIADRTLPRRC